MGYRDERETLKARVRELEARAERLRERVAENEAPIPKTKELVWETELAGTIDETGYEEMVALLRRELDPGGKIQRIGSTLTWSIEPTQAQPLTRFITVTVESRRGQTKIRIVEKLRQIYNQNIYGFTLGLGWLGAIPLAGAAAAVSPILVPIGLAFPFVAIYEFARRRYLKIARERRRELSAVVHELEKIAQTHARTMVRVEDDEEDVVEESEVEDESAELEAEA